jgi:outer membrane protein OmpA-like peptidoglycan-associated protein/osmotically-inducible protein OsmY
MRCNPWRWLWGLIPVAMLSYLTTQWEHERIEADLRSRAETALAGSNLRWATTAFDGRDALITGQAVSDDGPQRAQKVVTDVWGVRVADTRANLLPQVSPYVWSAAARGNRIKLVGHVPNDEARSTIMGVVKAAFPKSEIEDKLELARGAPDQNIWLGGIGFALKQLGALKSGTVNIKDTGLTIEGEAAGFAEYKSVKGALRNAMPGGIKLVADSVQPPLVSPYKWAAKRSGDQLVISGNVPDDAMREQVFSLARKTFPKLAIVDRLETAQGAPQGLAGVARAALEQLAALSSGEVQLTDQKVSLTGEAPDQGVATQVVGAFRSAAKGFQVVDAVTFPKPKAPVAAPYLIRAEAGPRELVLSGSVPSEEARAELLAAAAKRFSGRQITDRLAIASGEPAEWRACLDAGLAGLARLASGSLAMSDATMELAGAAADEATATRLPGDLRAAANRVCETKANITFDAPPEPDLTWRASHDGAGNVVLEGQVPDAQTRDQIVQSAGRLFANAKLDDRMKVANTASSKWQGTSLLGLKLLATLRKGDALIDRHQLTITGEARDTAIQAQIKDQLARSLAAPYEWREDVTVRSDAMIWSENEARRKAEEQQEKDRLAAEAARRQAEADARAQADAEAKARAAAEAQAKAAAEAEARRQAEEQRARERAAAAAEASRKAAEAEQAKTAAARKQEADVCQLKMRDVATNGTIRFGWASADLDRASLPTLDRLAEVAKACPAAKIEIGGHTDAEGTPERNASLSERRAKSVVAYLANVGVGADRMTAIGFGASQPIAPNDTADNRAKNRRIEFTVRAE